jgi:hypothetical protein
MPRLFRKYGRHKGQGCALKHSSKGNGESSSPRFFGSKYPNTAQQYGLEGKNSQYIMH